MKKKSRELLGFVNIRFIQKNFFYIFHVIFFTVLFCIVEAVADTPNCEISVVQSKIDENNIIYDLKYDVAEGWKPAKEPKITLVDSENIKNFSYTSTAECEKNGKNNYKIQIVLEKKSNEEKFYVNLEIQCPICSNICTIVTKYLHLSNESLRKISKNDTIVKSFLFILIFAFLGGLILNIMPCVLPVILMKLRSFSYSGIDFRNALVGTLTGNYFVFFVFATSIFFLKKSGEMVGWGMHFQNIIFLKFAAVMLFFMAMQAAELVSISLSLEIKNENKKIFVNNFISSVVAAFIALPCTAPFLGTVATFAIAEATDVQFFLIFVIIATGFSFPYLMILMIPQLTNKKILFSATHLQKFGKFFKQLVDYGVYLAFLWILWLLVSAYNFPWNILIISIFGLAFILCKKNLTKPALIAVIAILFIPNTSTKKNFAISEQIKLEDIIKRENISKNVVILNISADWCMTCHYNKMMVLNDSAIQHELQKNHVKLIEADMTEKNDNYMRFIQNHGRVGIPFTIIFGPAALNGILLPEIFSKFQLLEAIKKADFPT